MAHLETGMEQQLRNDSVQTLAWSSCSVQVPTKSAKSTPETKDKTFILRDVRGEAQAGRLLALMGPSGSGKTTLLNLLARRVVGKNVKTEGQVLVDGAPCPDSAFSKISSYVEQEDALIGSLTARETVDFCARLAGVHISSPTARKALVDSLITSFGLTRSANVLVGTPLRKGLSGGQKRRVSVAAQLVTGPKILFLDEPTSGLDSHASYEVVSFLKQVASKLRLIIIASIHQPSTTTFNLFDDLCLLARGQTCYFGPVPGVVNYFARIGQTMPSQINPAEYMLELANADFSPSTVDSVEKAPLDSVAMLHQAWRQEESTRTVQENRNALCPSVTSRMRHHESQTFTASSSASGGRFFSTVMTLLHRSFIKSYRDVLVYGVRIAMYLGLAILMGTVWVRMSPTQDYIQPFINSMFFGGAFMSFMAVAYIPAYIEDYGVFRKDRQNGLYGPLAFQLSNFLIGLPYLFLISFLFSVITYWLSNFRASGVAFFRWILFIYLDLIAAEALVVLVSSIFPIFVVALALVAFANGAWMATGGFLMPLPQLNPFYKYVFHYIDYQAYVFQGLMVNEFADRTYSCGSGCQCAYPTMGLTCRIPGVSVLDRYGYPTNRQGEWIGILVAIIAVYRLLCLLVVYLKKR